MQSNSKVFSHHLVGAALLALTCWQGRAGAAPLAEEGPVFEVLGQASYKERIALPPHAVFTVRVEDVSRADAASKLMAEHSRPLGGSQVPLAFKLTVAAAKVDPRHRYSLRATIHVDGKLRFTSSQHYPVLKEPVTGPLAVQLQSVAQSSAKLEAAAEAAPQPAQIAGLSLPQSFAGVLACADCTGIAHTLTLLQDGEYRLRLTYLGKPSAPFVEQGRWSIAQPAAGLGAHQLKLLGGGGEARVFLIQAPKTNGTGEASLRQLDREGRPFTSSANQLLRPTAVVDRIATP